KGQASDPKLPSYSPDGLALEPGIVELITAESSAPGQRHHHLRLWQGQVAVRSWLGEPGDRKNETGPIGWMRGVDWLPYQRRNFVTPAFPGFISGHSTFSRAAAEVLAAYTGSPYFPGGLGEFATKAGDYLVFEDGPSVDVTLQWATYFDAADQAGQSRIFGGIHIWPDDSVGRQLGAVVGLAAVNKAKAAFAVTP
ncbi:MAG: vanadium-dependent haloperoxidase, partial [Deltaproteobacteria bacterium]|nr:vanadium-dependent haloperoxidase [Deltaproteobacteria bacterium]